MLNLEQEKNRKISTQDAYDVISFAVQAADDSGFVNSFILERALYEYAVLIFYPELKDKYSTAIQENPNEVWDEMLEDGTLDNLVEDYSDDLNFLADSAKVWAQEYTEFEQSIHGFLNELQGVMGNANAQAFDNFQKAVNNDALQEVTDIADKWGMNNTPIKNEEPKLSLVKDDDKDSLFRE